MRLIAIADQHYRATAPEMRIDSDYFETLKDKGQFIFNYSRENRIRYIINAGDLYDQSIVPDRIKTWLTRNFKNFYSYTVLGQHDTSCRMYTDNSSIAVLIESGCLNLLDHNPIDTVDNVSIYGCSFGAEIPKIVDKSKYNILVIHKMISDKDRWSGHVQYDNSKMFLTKHKFNLIISGDCHDTHTCKIGSRLLINPGSLCRARIDQMNHRPCFFVVDTDTQEYEQVFIPVRPAEEVFNFNIKEKKSENEDLTKLMEELKIRRNHEFNYLKQAEEIALESELDEWTKGSMMEVINEINQKGLK